MATPAYTTLERLTAERIKDALEELAICHDQMRREGWHVVEDKDMRVTYLGVNAAMVSQNLTHAAAKRITQGKHEDQITRISEWSGYPDDAQEIQPDGTIK